jgi:hypothetical protein
MMDAIIEPRRIEDFVGFSVVERIDGVSFVRAGPLVSESTTNQSSVSSESSASSSDSEEEGGKRGRVLFLPGLDGSGCTLGPQVR